MTNRHMTSYFLRPTLFLVGMALSTTAGFSLAQEPSAPTTTQTAAQESAVPRLHLASDEWNFGTKWAGEPCKTEIEIANLGNAPLKITRIRSTCGCTGAVANRDEIPPGESDRLVITYNTKKKKEDVSQTLTLETNDPERPRAEIKVIGIVKQVVDVLPTERITFGPIDRATAATSSVELKCNMEEPTMLKLKPFEAPQPFDVKLEVIEAGRQYKLIAVTKPPLNLGANTTEVVVETGLEKFPTIVIPVSAYIAPRIYARPAKLLLSPAVLRPFVRSVRVYYRTAEPVEILDIKVSHPDLISVEKLPVPEPTESRSLARFQELRVTLPPGDKLPPEGAKIEIITSDPDPEYHTLVLDVMLRQPQPRPLDDEAHEESDEDTPSKTDE